MENVSHSNESICQSLNALRLVQLNSVSNSAAILETLDVLDNASKRLAGNTAYRQDLGCFPGLWEALHLLWEKLSELNDGDEDVTALARRVTLSTARLMRNLLPGCSENQIHAFGNEPQIRRMMHHYTSHSISQDENSYPTSRMLVQTLSNMVTSNEELIDQMWNIYMALPDEKNILLRTLGHPDSKTVSSLIVLILNCISQSPNRIRSLTTKRSGERVCVALLDVLASQVDAQEHSEGGEGFDLAYSVFTQIIDIGLFETLFAITTKDEIVAPHQTTLLKIADSYLIGIQNTRAKSADAQLRRKDITTCLVPKFYELSIFAQTSIRRSLNISTEGTSGPISGASELSSTSHVHESTLPQPPQELNMLLPKVCEAMVLVVQCFSTACLQEEAPVEGSAAATESRAQTRPLMRDLLLDSSSPDDRTGLLEHLVELLRLLHAFLPRITLVKTPSGEVRQISTPVHVPSSGNSASNAALATAPSAERPADGDTSKGFNYLKRDIMRLVGILCFERKAAQDRIRVCGGIPVIMNLCAQDERNPYIREHALFTLRNLLHGNAENQSAVAEIGPVVGEWDSDGVWRTF